MSADPDFSSPVHLAAAIRAGELSPVEAVEASLRRSEAVQARLNCFTLLDSDRALAAAREAQPGAERPFAGVPMALKDLGPFAEGMRLTFGSDLAGEFTPPFDDFMVARLRRAGFIFTGRTNTPEFGILPVTEPRRFGPARNPWDTARTPGGSSGGSAAAVAAGAVPVAHANDGGGSIRVPAACCGLVGLKPARGRVSYGPIQGESFLTNEGVVTRTVADTAALLDVIAGYEPGDSTWAAPPAAPFAASASRDPGALRIGLAVDPPLSFEPDPVPVAAVHEAGELLESLGHSVEPFAAPWGDPMLEELFMAAWAFLSGMLAQGLGALTGREAGPDTVEPLTMWLIERARGTGSLELGGALAGLQGFARGVTAALAPYDAVLTLTLGCRPLEVGAIDTGAADPRAEFRKAYPMAAYTAVANVTGQPAISLPFGTGEDGLPLAVQLIGRPAGEEDLIALAAQVEAARPWADAQPAVFAG
ncbi:MAG: amidase [Solirubrobacteraceae bacterium]